MFREQSRQSGLFAGMLGATVMVMMGCLGGSDKGGVSADTDGSPKNDDGAQSSGGGSGTTATGGSLGSGGSGQSASRGGAGAGATTGGPNDTGGAGRNGSADDGSRGSRNASGTNTSGGSADNAGSESKAGSGGAKDAGAGARDGGAGASGRESGGMGPAGGGGASTATDAAGRGGGIGNAGTCTPSKATGTNAVGTGSHKVTVETNSDPGIREGTIYRPTDLGGAEKYPVFVWGEGGCSLDGSSNSAAMAEIASHGYFVVADGTPNGTGSRTMDRSNLKAMGAPLMAYIDWAIAENEKPCSAYYQSLDTAKIASDGFSCGGLMSQATVMDPRIVTWGVSSAGMAGADQDFYVMIHTPVLFVEGGTDDMAYDGAAEGYEAIAKMDVPVLWFSKSLGHGGDLSQSHGGDFTKINLAWLNWWLKGDQSASGKGMLVGASCPFCSDKAWDVKSAHVP